MSTNPKALGVAMGGIASSSQAAVTTSVTTTRTTANLDATCDDIIVLVNQIRQDLISAGIITGSA